MQSKIFSQASLCLLLLGLLLGACNSPTKTEDQSTQNSEKAADSSSKVVEAIYQNCTVYASTTMFFFKTAQGDSIEVSILNKGMEEAALSAKVPDNLVEDSEGLEGLPGANPEMVGKKFRILYNEKGEVTEVQLAE